MIKSYNTVAQSVTFKRSYTTTHLKHSETVFNEFQLEFPYNETGRK